MTKKLTAARYGFVDAGLRNGCGGKLAAQGEGELAPEPGRGVYEAAQELPHVERLYL